MADRAEVPSRPLVTITVDDAGRVAINGHDVPHSGAADPRQVATEVVCSDFAQPLGRPVRAVATLPHEQVRMIVHPDGRVTDVERHQPATPAGVPPATRARAWLAARDADRIAAEVAAARHAGRHRRHPLFAAGAGAVVAGVALVVVWQQRSAPDPAAVAAPPPTEGAAADVAPPAQTVHESAPLRPVAVSGVSAEARPGELRLSIAAQRRTPVRLNVVPIADPAGAQRLDLSIRGQARRVVTVSDLDPGRYRWVVQVPGQPDQTGVTRVPDVPDAAETEPDTVPVTYDPPTSPGTSGGADGAADNGTAGDDGKPSRDSDRDDPPALTGVSTGPNQPIDPDGD